VTVNDQRVLAALRATGGSLTVAELGYQMLRRGRPQLGLGAVQASLARLEADGLVHHPYRDGRTWSAAIVRTAHA
jgi:hypothetical protein